MKLLERRNVKKVQPDWVKEQIEMSKYIGKRKYFEHLTDEETSSLQQRLLNIDINEWKMVKHAKQMIEERGIHATKMDLVSTVFDCNIIEYSINYNKYKNRCSERILVESTSILNDKFRLKVLFELGDNVIITSWLNDINDLHETLDYSRYDEDMKVFGI